VINLLGSFAAGALFGLGQGITPALRTGLMVGFLGGFTTFSAFALQGARMLAETPGVALAYLVLSPTFGVTLAWFGLSLTSKP
jgi:CrcB protein